MSGTALVTGASSGLGAAFARRFAADGRDLVLVARRGDRLAALAAELSERHAGIRVEIVEADLGAPGAARALVDEVDARGIRVDVVVNNAGFGITAPVVETDPDRVRALVDLDAGVVAELSTVYARRFVDRGSGGILNVSSTAGFQPVATMAAYSGAKAFVLHFTEALWAELHGTGVRVMALAPGGTRTEFFDVAGESESAGRHRMSAEEVVTEAIERFERSDAPILVPGRRNRLLAAGYRVAPRRLIARLSERVAGDT